MAALLSALLLILGAGWLWFRLTIERRWSAMRSEAFDLQRDLGGQSSARPVLRGDAVPGNAWDDYQPALESLGDVEWSRAGWKEVSDFLHSGTRANGAKVESMLTAHRDSIEALRRGVCRQEGAFPYHWPMGASMTSPRLNRCLALARLVACRARQNDREAPELLLDLAQFSCDLARNAPAYTHVYGMTLLRMSLDELEIGLRTLGQSRDDLLVLDRELELLDRSFPDIVPFERRDAMQLAFEFIETPDLHRTIRDNGCMCLPAHSIPPWGDWRFLFSDKAVALDGFRLAVECARRAEAARGGTWGQIRQAENEIQEMMKRTSNPLKNHYLRYGFHAGAREARARIRLLRVAARYRATREILDLEDPFGGRLLRMQSGSGLTVWSVGRDGTDDGGQDRWKGLDARDIVLVIGR